MIRKVIIIVISLALAVCITTGVVFANNTTKSETKAEVNYYEAGVAKLKGNNYKVGKVVSKYEQTVYSYFYPDISLEMGNYYDLTCSGKMVSKYLNIDVIQNYSDHTTGYINELAEYKITLYSTKERTTFDEMGISATNICCYEGGFKVPGLKEDDIIYIKDSSNIVVDSYFKGNFSSTKLTSSLNPKVVDGENELVDGYSQRLFNVPLYVDDFEDEDIANYENYLFVEIELVGYVKDVNDKQVYGPYTRDKSEIKFG